MLADVIVSEGALDEDEDEQDVEQRLNVGVGEAQGGSAVTVDDDRSLNLLESGFADKTIMTEALDVEQTSISCEADSSQLVEVFEAAADLEIAGIIDGCLGSQRLAFLVVLLDPALLVIDVQRRGYAVGNDPGSVAARCVAHNPAVQQQAVLT